ncbi:MAG TPA: hypothetical protein VIJ82_07945 [Streptosporangiaceae bacterium]
MIALLPGPVVFWACLLAERLQDGAERGRAFGGEVTVELAGALEGELQANATVRAAVVIVGVRLSAALAHIRRQRSQVCQVSPAGRGGEQDRVGSRAQVVGQQVRPLADLPGPGWRDFSRRQRVSKGGVPGKPVQPADRADGRAAGDARLPDQPAAHRAMAVSFQAAALHERRQ